MTNWIDSDEVLGALSVYSKMEKEMGYKLVKVESDETQSN